MSPLLANNERLRAAPPERPFHIVLVEPEIPPNTGNIARLCGATGSILHLVGPLGFSIDDKAVRRAGLDYWHLVDVQTHTALEQAERAIRELDGTSESPARSWLFTGRSSRSFLDVEFQPGDALVFGRESVGLPQPVLEKRQSQAVAIPTLGAVRSLNLANAVAITLYEALRQTGALSSTHCEQC